MESVQVRIADVKVGDVVGFEWSHGFGYEFNKVRKMTWKVQSQKWSLLFEGTRTSVWFNFDDVVDKRVAVEMN